MHLNPVFPTRVEISMPHTSFPIYRKYIKCEHGVVRKNTSAGSMPFKMSKTKYVKALCAETSYQTSGDARSVNYSLSRS